jgi:sugar phosphate isomerase/epimerase
MIIGCCTAHEMWKKSLEEILEEIKKIGINFVQLTYEYPHLFKKRDIETIKSFDFEYSMHGPFVHLLISHLNPRIRKTFIKIIKDSIMIAEKIGAKEYIIHGGVIPGIFKRALEKKGIDSRKYFLDIWIKEMKPIIENSDIKFLVENVKEDEIFGKPEDYLYAKSKISNLGFCFDIGHAAAFGKIEDWLNFETNYFHLSDNDMKNDLHLPIGKGNIPFEKFFSMIENLRNPQKRKNVKIVLEMEICGCKESIEKINEILSKI